MSRTEKGHPEDLDGWRKNVQKMGDEFGKVKDAVRDSGDSHDPITNAAVEATRASPYLMGHLILVMIAAAVIVGGILIYANSN